MRAIFDSEQEMFRDAARAFVTRELAPKHADAVSSRLIDRSSWQAAGRQGLLGLNVPERFGGAGVVDYRFSAALTEELAALSMGTASSMSIHYDVVAPYLVELGTDDQCKRWLPGFCAGETVTAIAMTEPSGGSDLAALRTSARPTGDGTWLVNGSKTFITNGTGADLIVLAARTGPDDRARGISLFAVETTRPGFRRGRKLDKMGQPEADTAELFFDDVVLSEDDLLGEIGQGFKYMMDRLPQERIGAAIANLAHVRPVVAETITYVQERKAFGSPVGSFQHNKFQLADIVTKLDVTQAFVDQCIIEHANGRLSPVQAAKAKWWTAQVQHEVLDACVQLFGGYGYMREYRVAQAWADARVTRIWAGSNEIMKELIGRDLGL